jgi:uncharacterized protein YndB with AHSA1/START domain
MTMNVTTSTDEPTITFTRVFAAPRELVYQAWTDPKHVAQWFGPRGFTVPHCELDVRVGGRWRIDMRAPDGTVYPNQGVYLEVDPPKRLLYSDVVEDGTAWGDDPPPSSTVEVIFEEDDGQTIMTTVTRLQSIEQRDAMVEMGAIAGWEETLAKLAEHLATA